jgi:hypothetical protein
MIRTHFVPVLWLTVLLVGSISGCKKGLPDPGKVKITDKPQFSANVDGNEVQYNESNSIEIYGGDHSISAIDTSELRYTVTLANQIGTVSYIDIKIGTLILPDGGYPNTAEFNGFFTTGSKAYSPDGLAGVQVTWWDETGTAWSTANGVPGGSFTLEEVKAETLLGDEYMKFKAVFSCTLYDGSGNSIELSEGLYLGYFANI